jgi:hypothetical protein|nr:MAG TPA: hypothetical protein [Caudoviricetes sp.]
MLGFVKILDLVIYASMAIFLLCSILTWIIRPRSSEMRFAVDVMNVVIKIAMVGGFIRIAIFLLMLVF